MREKFATMSERASDNTEEIDEIDKLSAATETDEKAREENEKVITWENTIHHSLYKWL